MSTYKYGNHNCTCNTDNVIRNNEWTGGYPLPYLRPQIPFQKSSLKYLDNSFDCSLNTHEKLWQVYWNWHNSSIIYIFPKMIIFMFICILENRSLERYSILWVKDIYNTTNKQITQLHEYNSTPEPVTKM